MKKLINQEIENDEKKNMKYLTSGRRLTKIDSFLS